MSFFSEVIQKSPQFHSTARCADLNLLEPTTRAAVEAIIADAAAFGQPLMVFETFRSQERQELLYKQRATEIHTAGVHHYGLACDLVKSIDGEPSWKGSFDFLGMLAIKHNMVWGGAWRTLVDADHVQRVAVKDQAKLFAGVWYPDQSYNPYLSDPTISV